MDQTSVITEAQKLVTHAAERSGAGFPDQAQARLVSLRELLNKQPELEAGGEPAPAEPPGHQPEPFKSP